MNSIVEIFGIEVENNQNFQSALTHPSYTKEHNLDYGNCYERFEFLGDAVLKLVISDILYKKFPDSPEGEMSKIRSIVVSDHTLSSLSKKIGLDALIIASEHDTKLGVKSLESVTACVFEAVLGAYYLDGKFIQLREKLEEMFVPVIEEISENIDKYNAKALLQEYTQSIDKKTPIYKVVKESGPAHNKIFTVEVEYNEAVIASAEGKSKKEAEQKCAYLACQKLGVVKCQK